ncbi:MAG TPA: hypothetical protein VKV28_05335 [Candidatus Binataceae bacterium]|nr:hypothetical protein [Candidatus Binataceae bacterium]
MDQQAIDNLIRRMAILERDHHRLTTAHRRMKLGGAVIIAVLAILGVMGQAIPPQPKIIEAQGFVVRDLSGVVRGAIGIADDGSVGVNLNDRQGNVRATMDVAALNDTPGVDLYDKSGHVRATLALDTYGTPGLGFYDSAGKLRMSLDIPAKTTPGLGFYDKSGKGAFGIP